MTGPKIFILGMCVLGLSSNTSPAVGAEYSIFDLGTLGGSNSVAESINNCGYVTGYSDIAGDGEVHAFLYDGGVLQDLGLLAPGDVNSRGYGINDSGQVAGYGAVLDYYGHDTAYRSFIYSAGNMQDIDALLPTSCNLRSKAYDINNSGQITGYCAYEVDDIWGTEKVHTFYYDGNVMHDLSVLGADSIGYAINNSGFITGYTRLPYPDFHAYIYNGTSVHDLGTLGGSSSHGYAINDLNEVTGGSWIAGENGWHAFYYDGNNMHDLGTLGGNNSTGYGINYIGYIVGQSDNADGDSVAFVYDGQSMQDLCGLTDCASHGWSKLLNATDIDDYGNIVGYGLNTAGDKRAFLILSDGQPPPAEEVCDDGIDNDGDGLVDNADPDCATSCVPTSKKEQNKRCFDGLDNDCDGLIDGADPDCGGGCSVSESPEVSCSDGVDNDCDDLIDAADPDCGSSCSVSESPEVSCGDGVDNDCDGSVDSDDPDCGSICIPSSRREQNRKCVDGLDNDCDGLIDADDPDCS